MISVQQRHFDRFVLGDYYYHTHKHTKKKEILFITTKKKETKKGMMNWRSDSINTKISLIVQKVKTKKT